jgi:hypothetical protein
MPVPKGTQEFVDSIHTYENRIRSADARIAKLEAQLGKEATNGDQPTRSTELRVDPRPEEIEQRTADLGRGLEALVWFQDWSARVLVEVGNAGTSPGTDGFVDQAHPASKEQWVMQSWAMLVELVELVNAVGWKPWKETPPPDPSEVMYEDADVLAFLGNILRYILALPGASIRPHELADVYARVVQRNVARYRGQVPGYNVPRSTKSSTVEDGAKSWLADKTNGPLPSEQRPRTRVVAHIPDGLPAEWLTDTSGERLTQPTIGTYVVPEPGLYRHFKGGTYEVLGTVLHSETREPMVRYRRVDGSGPEHYEQVRPANTWSDLVVEVMSGTGYVGPRFVPIKGVGGG